MFLHLNVQSVESTKRKRDFKDDGKRVRRVPMLLGVRIAIGNIILIEED
jgi:hypothetical protein